MCLECKFEQKNKQTIRAMDFAPFFSNIFKGKYLPPWSKEDLIALAKQKVRQTKLANIPVCTI